MDRPRWPVIAALAVVGVLLAVGGWAIGRSSQSAHTVSDPADHRAAITTIRGTPVGVSHSRAGALAAADNYVATSSQTVIEDPTAFARLVRGVWMPAVRQKGLTDAETARRAAPEAVTNYSEGGRGISVIAARKLESYSQTAAKVLTWGGGFVWGPRKAPAQRWFLVRTNLVWTGDRWRVQSLNELARPAPVPYQVALGGRKANKASTFETELRGMSAPIYGTAG